MPVIELETQEQFEHAVHEDRLTVVDAFATWCGPCAKMLPVVDRLANEHPEAQFLKLDVDELEELSEELNVTSMPTFVFFQRGHEVFRISGANAALLEEKVKEFAATPPRSPM